jgi:hypothetical protein
VSRRLSEYAENRVGSVAQCDDSKFVSVSKLCGSFTIPWGEFGDFPTRASTAAGHELWCNALSFTTEGEGGSGAEGGKHGSRCQPEHLALGSNTDGQRPVKLRKGSKQQQQPTLVRDDSSVENESPCDTVVGVTLDSLLWHYNVSTTRPKLQDLYYG